MGGRGSGNWYRWQGKKASAEESLAVAIWDFRGRIHPLASGKVTWTCTSDGHECSVGYVIDPDGPTIILLYRWRDSEDVRMPVRLQTTPARFGGKRWWFTCPLTVNGVACNRRVGKLYVPPGARYFGCRKCHELTYRSCQEAHQTERLFGRLGIGCDPEIRRNAGTPV